MLVLSIFTNACPFTYLLNAIQKSSVNALYPFAHLVDTYARIV